MVEKLERAGAEVAAIVGRTRDSARETAVALSRTLDREISGYAEDDWDRLVGAESVDAVVIASPYSTHDDFLGRALEAGWHTLCEKPLLWFEGNEGEITRRARDLTQGFVERGLILRECVQWPKTLASYYELFPQQRGHTPRLLSVLLSPASRGESAILDSFSHVLSLAGAIWPDYTAAEIEEVLFGDPEDPEWRIEVRLVSVTDRYRLMAKFRMQAEPPRPAGYGLDGVWAQRKIRLPEYTMTFVDPASGTTVPVPDPLDLLLTDFVQECLRVESGQAAGVDPQMTTRMRHLEELVSAFRRERGADSSS